MAYNLFKQYFIGHRPLAKMNTHNGNLYKENHTSQYKIANERKRQKKFIVILTIEY